MKGIRTTFYADRDDLNILAEAFSYLGNFAYTMNYWDEGAPFPSYQNPRDIPDFGLLNSQSASICGVALLITDASQALNPQQYVLQSGKARLKVDNTTDPDSARLCVGGDAGESILIASQIDTLGLTARAREIQSAFSHVIRERSANVDGYRVLPGAMLKLQSGWRLCFGKTYSPSLDLKLK